MATKKKTARKAPRKKSATRKKRVTKPRKELDLDRAKKLVGIFCTAEDVACDQGMGVDTLNTRLREAGYSGFSDFQRQHVGKGRQSLRAKQFQRAMAGSDQMLKWLGIHHLDQSERLKVEGAIKLEDATRAIGRIVSVLEDELRRGKIQRSTIERVRDAVVSTEEELSA